MNGTALYRFHDEAGRLLYVGIAYEPRKRLRDHKTHAAWFEQAASFSIEWFGSRGSAAAAETDAIRTEWPLWNVINSPDPSSVRQLRPIQSRNVDSFDSEVRLQKLWITRAERQRLTLDDLRESGGPDAA